MSGGFCPAIIDTHNPKLILALRLELVIAYQVAGDYSITCQFGASFDACEFGAFHFDAVPVRHDASLARFTLPRFSFLCLNCTEVFSTSVWHVSRFAPMLIEYASMV